MSMSPRGGASVPAIVQEEEDEQHQQQKAAGRARSGSRSPALWHEALTLQGLLLHTLQQIEQRQARAGRPLSFAEWVPGVLAQPELCAAFAPRVGGEGSV